MNETVGQVASSISQSSYITSTINSIVGIWQSTTQSISSALGIDSMWIAFFVALIGGYAIKEYFPSLSTLTIALILFALFVLLKLEVVR